MFRTGVRLSAISLSWVYNVRSLLRYPKKRWVFGTVAFTGGAAGWHWKESLRPREYMAVRALLPIVGIEQLDSVSSLALFHLSLDYDYALQIGNNGCIEKLGVIIDNAIASKQQGGTMKRSTFYSLACLSNLARIEDFKEELTSELWIQRFRSLYELREHVTDEERAYLFVCLSSMIASLAVFSDEQLAMNLVQSGVLDYLDVFLRDTKNSLELGDYLQTIRKLLAAHHEHPLSLPKSSVDIQYSHMSSASSWCHFLENKACNNYLLLFSLIAIAELSRHESVCSVILEKGIFSSLEFSRERMESDIVVKPELIRTLCHLAKKDEVKSLLVSDEVWIESITHWSTSNDHRILLFTAYLLSILIEKKEIGVRVIHQLGFERLVNIVDIVDIDVRHTLEHLFRKLQEQESLESNQIDFLDDVYVTEDMEIVDFFHKESS